MSFDLGVWYPQERITDDEAGELYVRLLQSDTSGVLPHPAIKAFYAELTARHPEIDTIPEERIGDYDYCPWSCALDHSPGYVIMPCVWSKATYVDQLVHDLARKHGLVVYDPQASKITYPDGSTGKKAKQGLSRGARWTLGIFALLFGAMFVFSEQTAASSAPMLVYLLAGFCGLIAVACFSQTWRGPAVRIIGFMVFVTYVFYIAHELRGGPAKPHIEKSESHWLDAILGLIVFGLPGLYVAFRGRYPKWGEWAAAFKSQPPSSNDEEGEGG